MKTTLELPDDLFAAAKATALRRRVTLKALVTRALERELRGGHAQGPHPRFEVDESGWPVRRPVAGEAGVITDAFIATFDGAVPAERVIGGPAALAVVP